MQIHVLPSGPIQTLGYLLTEPRLGEAVLIDAPGDIITKIKPLLASDGCTLTELWLTHGHWDHIQEAAQVKREFGVKVLAHADDRVYFDTPEVMDKFIEDFLGLTLRIEPVAVDKWINQGDRLRALGDEFEVRHVPGHCPGNVLFYLATLKAAWVGDTLFKGGLGRWDFPGGSLPVLVKAIRNQIYSLPDETVVYPGHGPATTVRTEKLTNPYVPPAEPLHFV